ncbi:MAG: hypothetical protein DRJ03_01025 [Chloroflexi bacterium]|nr:MAG: hypothetical protein DRJ03_01025 [Chloroflexota bacterium]
MQTRKPKAFRYFIPVIFCLKSTLKNYVAIQEEEAEPHQKTNHKVLIGVILKKASPLHLPRKARNSILVLLAIDYLTGITKLKKT